MKPAAIRKSTWLTLSGYLNTELNCILSCGYVHARVVWGFEAILFFFFFFSSQFVGLLVLLLFLTFFGGGGGCFVFNVCCTVFFSSR